VVRLRLQRLGRRNRPFYRLNAIDQRTRRDGRVIENLGFYDPLAPDQTKQIQIDGERVKYWISVGAQPSETVRDMLAKRGFVDAKVWEQDRTWQRKRSEAKKAAAAAAPAEEKKA
jgi:small subunit ribosomal protein S16